MICFNGHKSPNLWGVKEWEFFLNDLETHLTPQGRICLGFNREKDGSLYTEELRQFLESRGARMFSDNVVLSMQHAAPTHRERRLTGIATGLEGGPHGGARCRAIEPKFKSQRALVQQHRQAVGAARARAFRGHEQRGGRLLADQIVNHQVRCEQRVRER